MAILREHPAGKDLDLRPLPEAPYPPRMFYEWAKKLLEQGGPAF